MASDQRTSSVATGPRRADPPRRLDLDLGNPLAGPATRDLAQRAADTSYDSDEHDTPEERTPMHPSFQNGSGDFISSGPQPGHATRPSIDETNAASKYFPTMPSASTLHTSANPLDTGHTTDSDALARAQTNFSAHSRTPLNEPAPGFPGVDENGRIHATDYATPSASGTVTPERHGKAQHVHYPPSVDPAQYYTTVPLDGQDAAGYNMHMDEKNGTAGSGSSAKKRGVLFGGAKRWSQGGQKDVELAGEKPPHFRQASWDMLRGRGSRPSSVIGGSGANTPAGGRSGSATPRVEWEGFDFNTANSSVEQLRFAEGDVGKSKASKE
ncbi:hypothetical protein QFC20_006471 [Naganishia adeliensis]|uniref:Uncharacterized protein n=1 Tax=Naganishia adeliensis TaxID=92952 RepID=A0ACC2VCD6_9TREE|nr:hypothetical protein QFC20_006471 [Naganishia adeliensis]